MFVRKIRGSTLLKFLLDSNRYVYSIVRSKDTRSYWRCLSRTRRCPARVVTVDNAIAMVTGEHNHESNFDPTTMDICYGLDAEEVHVEEELQQQQE